MLIHEFIRVSALLDMLQSTQGRFHVDFTWVDVSPVLAFMGTMEMWMLETVLVNPRP